MTHITLAKAKTVNFAQALNGALHAAMELDDSVIVLGEDVGDGEGGGVLKITQGLSDRFGTSRVRSTPISEQAIIGAAIGSAIVGMRPVAEIMLMNFTTVAMDMITNHAAKLRYMSGGQTHVPMTIRTMTGVGYATGGQHSDMLEAWFAHTAGLKVVAPSSPADAAGLLTSCIFDDDPCIFIENLPTYGVTGPAPVPGARIPLGKANVLREGSDVSVIGYARPIGDIVAVAGRLAKEGISVEIIDLRTISPWDKQTVIESAAKTGRVVVVHEAVRNFGVGAEVVATLQEELFGRIKAPIRRVAAPYAPVPFSKPLEAAFTPGKTEIEAAIRSVLG
jgi:pyruvate/2-oxoglutarate/acetoin dehydrogenase E1 component